ncbi:MAG TPA: hypothetical protein VMH82_00720 [Myxococcota bacterium]|nr:hypothetical protein [Myxococcota bacterium]
MPAETTAWRRCSSCKTPLAFRAPYWVCNVSTCNRPRTGLFFCSVSCWDAHLSVVNHRESWALERRAPTREEWEREQQETSTRVAPEANRSPRASPQAAEGSAQRGEAERSSQGRATAQQPSAQRGEAERSSSGRAPAQQLPRDVLIVISKLKSYVRARSGFNTSDRVVEPLSDAVRALCERAIEKARADGRKTVLERDFE